MTEKDHYDVWKKESSASRVGLLEYLRKSRGIRGKKIIRSKNRPIQERLFWNDEGSPPSIEGESVAVLVVIRFVADSGPAHS